MITLEKKKKDDTIYLRSVSFLHPQSEGMVPVAESSWGGGPGVVDANKKKERVLRASSSQQN